jgi:hypothetical protein
MTEYDGPDLRDGIDNEEAQGMPDERLPPGWTRFDPDQRDAGGEEAYLFANGHQVLLGRTGDGTWFVLAYPEHGTIDLMGFVRPLAGDTPTAMAPPAGDRTRARDFAHGYMTAVAFYEDDAPGDELFDY